MKKEEGAQKKNVRRNVDSSVPCACLRERTGVRGVVCWRLEVVVWYVVKRSKIRRAGQVGAPYIFKRLSLWASVPGAAVGKVGRLELTRLRERYASFAVPCSPQAA